MKIPKSISALLVAVILAGCGGRAFIVEPVNDSQFRDRAIEKTDGDVTVRATVLNPEETERVFGLSLYDQGIQPVWIEVVNGTKERIRYAPVGTDPEYFSPLEVSYKNRSGYSDEARDEMDRLLYTLGMDRHVEPGETVAGFVHTHKQSGTKGFNVDLFGSGRAYRLNFFVTTPGFEPDHANIEFASIYTDDEWRAASSDDLYEVLKSLDCCTGNSDGDSVGFPMNVVLVGEGIDILYSLLRASWRETDVNEQNDEAGSQDYYYFGRRQDAIFRYSGDNRIGGYYELRLWLSPVRNDGVPVWAGQLRRFVDHKWSPTKPEADVDAALWFLLQNLWYSETLKNFAWIQLDKTSSLDAMETDFQGMDYFSRGMRSVLWISGSPVSLSQIQLIEWDPVSDRLANQ